MASKCDVSKEHQVASNVSLLVLVTALEISFSFVAVVPFLFHQNICCEEPGDKNKAYVYFEVATFDPNLLCIAHRR